MPAREIAMTVLEVGADPVTSTSVLCTGSTRVEVDTGYVRQMEIKIPLLLLMKTSLENTA